jgi:hypothetical protein
VLLLSAFADSFTFWAAAAAFLLTETYEVCTGLAERAVGHMQEWQTISPSFPAQEQAA